MATLKSLFSQQTLANHMQYNTTRSALPIPEYGRHVQRMVDHLKSISDEEQRNKTAKAIINVMGNLNPHLRDVPDFQHKLWDQLFVMADYNLDVESPYPIPDREKLNERPERMAYPTVLRQFKYYGKNVLRMVEKVVAKEEGDEKEALTMILANQMKKCYLLWNKDTVDDRVILNHLDKLSDGKIKLDPEKVELTASSKLVTFQPKKTYKRRKKR